MLLVVLPGVSRQWLLLVVPCVWHLELRHLILKWHGHFGSILRVAPSQAILPLPWFTITLRDIPVACLVILLEFWVPVLPEDRRDIKSQSSIQAIQKYWTSVELLSWLSQVIKTNRGTVEKICLARNYV